QHADALAQLRRSDADEAPGLHQANAGRLVGSVQQSGQQLGRHLTTGEMPHVPALGDSTVYRVTLRGSEGMVGHGSNVLRDCGRMWRQRYNRCRPLLAVLAATAFRERL